MPRLRLNALIGFVLMFAGCAIEQEISRTPRTAVEQLLLTTAVEVSLKNLTVSLPEHSSLAIEISGLQTDRANFSLTGIGRGVLHDPSMDFMLIRDVVAASLGHQGYNILSSETQPDYLARIIVESFGTTQGLTFVGMPPIQSVLIPFALPELTLYKHQEQRGYSRLHIDFFDIKNGNYLGRTATVVGRTEYNQYTVFFYVTWVETDLSAPP